MAGALHLVHRHPAHGEAKRLELGAHHLRHLEDAGDVASAAVLSDPFFEQRDHRLLIGIDRRDDLLFGRGEFRRGRSGGEREQCEHDGGADHGRIIGRRAGAAMRISGHWPAAP